MRRTRARWAWSAILFAACAASAAAQESGRPRSYVIENARVATVSGAVIESASVVLKDGLIQAVGRNVEVPPDAWRIDGEGKTVYPGFIDAFSSLGLSAPKSAGETPLSRGPEDRPATTPWVVAADSFSPAEEDTRKWRAAGFTSVAAAPLGGMFSGRVSMMNLSDGSNRERTVAAKTALVTRLPEQSVGYRGYPGALLGRIAYVKQVFLDARRDAGIQALYEADPKGLERPAYERSLTAIAEDRAAGLRVLYPADTAVEIRRALGLRDQGYLERTAIYGARQAYETAAELGETPALIDVSWPEARKGADPEADVPLRTLRFRDRAPTTPAALAEAGALFAFFASEAKSPEDLVKGVRRAVERGLPRERAIRALTLDAARFHGVEDRLGAVEPGKIANLAVFEGDPLAEGARAQMVFIDGVKYDAPPKPDEASPEKEQTGGSQ